MQRAAKSELFHEFERDEMDSQINFLSLSEESTFGDYFWAINCKTILPNACPATPLTIRLNLKSLIFASELHKALYATSW